MHYVYSRTLFSFLDSRFSILDSQDSIRFVLFDWWAASHQLGMGYCRPFSISRERKKKRESKDNFSKFELSSLLIFRLKINEIQMFSTFSENQRFSFLLLF